MFDDSGKIKRIYKLGQSQKCRYILSNFDLNLRKRLYSHLNGYFEKRTGNFNNSKSYSYQPATICSGNAEENKV